MKRSFLLILTIIALTACNDDYFEVDPTTGYSDMIGYNVKVSASDEFKSRGTDTHTYASVEALDETIGGNPLYLHTVVSDTIPKYVTAAKNGIARPQSRGSITESVDEIAVSAIVINGSSAPKGWPATGESQMYMNNETVTEEYNWTTGRYWPQEQDSIRFYAYSPVGALDDESQDYTKGLPSIANSQPGFYYCVNDVVEDQQDILVASAQYKGNYCQPAQINMCHALTAVEIHLSKEIKSFTLKKLTISGVKTDGIYSYMYSHNAQDDTDSHDAGTWSNIGLNGERGEYVLYENEEGIVLDGTAQDDINLSDGKLVLMMMPQDLDEKAKITVEGYDHVLKEDVPSLVAEIGGDGKKWNKGEHVIYRLSYNPTRIEYILEVTPTRSLDSEGRYISPYHGETNIDFNVRSFKRTISSDGYKDEPIDWVVDESTLPAWLDHITLSGSDNATGTYSVLPNLTNSTTHNILKNNAQLGTEDAPWDLSTNAVYNEGTDPLNTANCYIVTAPGWYTLPLVYGNAITNGSDNTSAYLGDINGSGSLRPGTSNVRRYDVQISDNDIETTIPIQTLIKFCAGRELDKPWITDTNNRGGYYTPETAKLVWQDEPCLVTDIKLNANKDYIIFRVPDVSINEGNAVISVRGATHVCWSWHIWVTDQIDRCNGNGDVSFNNNDITLTNRFVTSGFKENAQTPSEWGSYQEYDFKVMPSNIGACDADTKTYTKATCDVKFKLIENGEEVVENISEGIYYKVDALKVGVESASINMTDNAPYYQFGRKDPMIPGLGNGQDKPVYLNDRTKKAELAIGGYQDVFYKISDTQGNDNGTTIDFGPISLHVGVHNPEYFFGGDSNTERNIDGLMYETWTTRETYGDETIPDFFINLWDGTFNNMPVYSHANISNAVDFYNEFKKALGRSVVKTIYDPCPVGYEMPRFDVYTGFSFEGQNVSPFLIEDISVAAGYSLVDEVNIDDIYPSISALTSSGTYQGLKFFTKTMPGRQVRSAADIASANDRIYIHALGHRNNQGKVAAYNHYANALTATPLCARWINENELNDYYKFQGCRLCVIGKSNYSMRSISTSSFDLAFPVIPAKTGCNPSTVVVDNNNKPDNVYWSDGNETDFSGDFN